MVGVELVLDSPQVETPLVERDERLARRDLREQVARLERALQDTLISAFPRTDIPVALEPPVRPAGGARLLSLGELEALRDALSARLTDARRALAERAEREEQCRALLERALLDPGKHRFLRLPLRDLGEEGCGVWQVRPRLGLVGMLSGWWHVKLSSGCPLAWGRR